MTRTQAILTFVIAITAAIAVVSAPWLWHAIVYGG